VAILDAGNDAAKKSLERRFALAKSATTSKHDWSIESNSVDELSKNEDSFYLRFIGISCCLVMM